MSGRRGGRGARRASRRARWLTAGEVELLGILAGEGGAGLELTSFAGCGWWLGDDVVNERYALGLVRLLLVEPVSGQVELGRIGYRLSAEGAMAARMRGFLELYSVMPCEVELLEPILAEAH